MKKQSIIPLLFGLTAALPVAAQDIEVVGHPAVGVFQSSDAAGTVSVAALTSSDDCISPELFMMSVPDELKPSGVGTIGTNAADVIVKDGKITVNGTDDAALVELYGINGQLLYHGKEKSISVPDHGVYVVKVAGITKKIVL